MTRVNLPQYQRRELLIEAGMRLTKRLGHTEWTRKQLGEECKYPITEDAVKKCAPIAEIKWAVLRRMGRE